jgi:hypothetical protein
MATARERLENLLEFRYEGTPERPAQPDPFDGMTDGEIVDTFVEPACHRLAGLADRSEREDSRARAFIIRAGLAINKALELVD